MSLVDQQVPLKLNAIAKICKYTRLHEGATLYSDGHGDAHHIRA